MFELNKKKKKNGHRDRFNNKILHVLVIPLLILYIV